VGREIVVRWLHWTHGCAEGPLDRGDDEQKCEAR
jgi:hypothetical protein